MTNIVLLDGRFTDDPEIRQTKDGAYIANFTIAVNRNGKDAGADFIRCKAFRQTAETIGNYCHKGTRVLVNGSINTGSYENREGKTVYTTDIVVNRFEFLEKKNAGIQAAAPDPKADVPEYMDIPDSEDGFAPFI